MNPPSRSILSPAWKIAALLGLLALLNAPAFAQVPTIISYQGRVQMNGTNTGAITDSGNDDVLVIRAGTYNKATAGNWVSNANRVLSSRKGTVRLTRQ